VRLINSVAIKNAGATRISAVRGGESMREGQERASTPTQISVINLTQPFAGMWHRKTK